MSKIIERVARAIAAEEGFAYDPTPYNKRARAAIEAMRNPLSKTHDEIEYVKENDRSRQGLNDRFNTIIDIILSDD